MICDFCKNEVVVPEMRELVVAAWCPNCGSFSDGKEPMKLPRHATPENKLPSVEELIVRVFPELSLATASIVERFLKSREKTCTCAEIMADDSTRHFRGCPMREKHPTHASDVWLDTKDEWSEIIDAAFPTRSGSHENFATAMKMVGNRNSKAALVALVNWLLVERDLVRDHGDIYRETCKNAQEAGTNLWNKVVRVKNLLRVAQPYLEKSNWGMPEELELAALCIEVEKEIGSLEDNTTEEDGATVAERLGIDIEKWAAELRAKVDAADVADAKREAREKGTER